MLPSCGFCSSFFFFSSRRRHTRSDRDWSSDVCSSDLADPDRRFIARHFARVTAWADRHRVERGRVLLGEFGALRTDERYVAALAPDQIGRASCRERVEISVVAVSLKKKKKNRQDRYLI